MRLEHLVQWTLSLVRWTSFFFGLICYSEGEEGDEPIGRLLGAYTLSSLSCCICRKVGRHIDRNRCRWVYGVWSKAMLCMAMRSCDQLFCVHDVFITRLIASALEGWRESFSCERICNKFTENEEAWSKVSVQFEEHKSYAIKKYKWQLL